MVSSSNQKEISSSTRRLLLLLGLLLPVTSMADGLCPNGWKMGPNMTKCFILMKNSLSWGDSEAICVQLGAHLGDLNSNEDPSFAETLMADGKNDAWVGGQINCSKSMCKVNGSDSCALLTRGKSVALVGENCSAAHNFICMTDSEGRCDHNHCHKEYFIVIAVVSGLILSTAIITAIWFLIYRQNRRRRRSRKGTGPAASALVPPLWRVFSSEEIRLMTKNFSEGNRLVGDAKTGGTYCGVLQDGTRVAVKRLRKSRLQRKREFFSEVGRVAKLHHPNLVAVKGCCYDHGDRYIIYEFISNGPLDRWLHGPKGARVLDWGTRMRVATTLAQAIAFLHDKVKPQVVHRDIRASNVLLDEEFGSHLMGLGLSKFVYWEVMHEKTKVAGSSGYLAPEFRYQNELTTKSDVFSFGVLLLEIVSGRRPAQTADPIGGPSILHWATPLVQANRYMELLDPLILIRPEPGAVHKVVDLVYACTQIVPAVRPRMSHVVHQLQQISASSAASSSGSASPATSTMLPLEVIMSTS